MLDIYTFRQISNFTREDVIAVTEAIEYSPEGLKGMNGYFRPRNLSGSLAISRTCLNA